VRRLLLCFALLLTNPPAGDTAKQCDVRAVPKVSLAPLRYVRITVTIESPLPREARVELNGPDGPESSSTFAPDSRTRQIEWKNVFGGPGEYTIDLGTSSGCNAHDRLLVSDAGQ
jgi:hypothetical protein